MQLYRANLYIILFKKVQYAQHLAIGGGHSLASIAQAHQS